MKIAVIGKGTASIITTLVLLKHGHEVVVYYDPNSESLSVGESTTPHILSLLSDVLDINIHDMVDNDIASLKCGIKFINWGKSEYFLHHFTNKISFHLENNRFNPIIHQTLENNGLVKYIPRRVEKVYTQDDEIIIEGDVYDFSVFCSGWVNQDNYIKPLFETVNSAVLYDKDNIDEHSLYTLHRATEDGWEFGLPFPKRNVTKHGYLFDRNKIDKEKVFEKINSKKYFEWTPRYCKKLLQNSCLAYNGNRLFFIEPLQALTFYYTKDFAEKICEYLEERTIEKFYSVNDSYLYEMWTYQLSLAYHYQYGSTYETSFWNEITEKAKNFISCIHNGNRDIFLENLINDLYFKGEYSKIGVFDFSDLKQLHCGMVKENINDIIAKYYPSNI